MAYFLSRAVITALISTVFSLSALTAQNTVRGIVLDPSDEPVPGASVTWRQGDETRSVQTDAEGRYRLANIPDGKAEIEVSHLVFIPQQRYIDVTGPLTENFTLRENVVLMDEVVVSATRAGADDPFAQSIVSAEELKRDNYGQNIPFLLGGTPSLVFTSDDGTGFGYSSMRIRGSDATRVNVTINDIPLNDAESQSVFWVNLPDIASSASDIQVQRGAGSSTNGAGAFGGSVNITTLHPRDKAGADLTYNVGSFGAQKFSAAFSSGLLGNHYEITGRLSRAYSDGYIERASSDMSSYFLSAGYYDDKTTVKVLGFGGHQTTYQAWNGVDAATLKTNRRFNSCGAIYDKNWEHIIGYYDDENDKYWQDHLQLIANRQLGAFQAGMTLHYTFGRGYYESYKQDADMARYKIGPITVGDQIIESCDLINQKWLYNHFYGGTAHVTYEKKKITATLSGAYNRYDGDHYGEVIWAQYTPDSPKNQRYYDNNTTKNDGNIFLKGEYRPVKGLSVYADLQYRNIGLNMQGVEDEGVLLDITRSYSFFNPKAGINYQITPAHRVYASYARASKEPNRADFTDSPVAPRPEYLDDFEFGYVFSQEKVNVSANVYYMNYKDQLVNTGEMNDTGYPIQMNVDKSYRLGIELQAQYQPVRWFAWGLNATFSDNRIRGMELSDGSCQDKKISYSPALIAHNVFTFRPVEALRVDFSSRYVGEQYMSNNNIPESKLDAYFVSDLSASYDIKKSRYLPAFTLRGQLNNVFNKMYISNGSIYGTDAYYFPQAGINFMLGVDIRF